MARSRADQEKAVQTALHATEGGDMEVSTPVGYIDLLTSRHIIECKTWECWKSAIGQVLSYRFFYPDKVPRIHLFDTPTFTSIRSVNLLKHVANICDGLGIEVTLQIGETCVSADSHLGSLSAPAATNREALVQILQEMEATYTKLRATLGA